MVLNKNRNLHLSNGQAIMNVLIPGESQVLTVGIAYRLVWGIHLVYDPTTVELNEGFKSILSDAARSTVYVFFLMFIKNDMQVPKLSAI